MIITDGPIKVLHVFGRLARAGMESRTVELQRFIDRDRFRVDFCSLAPPGAGDLDEEVRSLGSTVHYVPLGGSLSRRFRALLRRERYDVVHAHLHYFSGLMVRLAAREGVPRRVVHFRITSDCRADTPARRLQRFVMKRWIAKYATKILAVNEGSLSLPWDPNWRSDPRCQVLYTGIDASRFDGP